MCAPNLSYRKMKRRQLSSVKQLTMKGTTKSKAVTSGRLTGRVKEQVARRRVQSPDAGPAACPKPAYSLYSTDSEDQVSCLHHGLDRCAALLNDILQADKPGCLRSVTGAASSKSRPCSSPAKKATKASKTGFSRQSLRTQTSTVPTSCPPPDQRSCPSVRQGPGRSNFQRAGSPVPLPQTSIPPPQTSIPPSQTSILPPQTSIPSPQTSIPSQQTCIPPPQTSILPPQTSIPSPQTSIPSQQTSIPSPQTSIPSQQTCIPPSQTSTPPPQTSAHPSDQLSVPHTDLHAASNSPPTSCKAECDGEEDEDFVPVRDTDTGSTAGGHLKVSGMRPGFPEDGDASEDVKLRTVQYLLGEIKALIAGRGSVAEKLLSHLEQTVTDVAGSNPSSIYSRNPQLRRCVRTPLKDRGTAERQQNLESLSNSEVSSLQEDLGTAQVRLQDIQEDLAGLRQALQDTRSQLADREAENARLRTDLEATKSRLLDREQEQSRLASVAQQRLEEIGNLNRLLHCSSRRPQDVASSGSTTPVPAESPAERIGHFLSTLGSTQGGQEVTSAQLGDASPQHCGWQHTRPSLCGSVCSDWSVRSGSTFDTRDEAAFRAGLAALDASIASLQKTLQQDLK